MSPFDLLGLAADADERAIKRAYAQRLRVTRPEDDPDGFQQLHAAYQAALESCRDAATDTSAASHEPAIEEPLRTPHVSTTGFTARTLAPAIAAAAEPPALPRFDPDTFCIAAFEQAAAGDAAALQAWLAGRQDLWSLQLKTRTGAYLVERLHEQMPPMPSDCMETLLRFFDLDHALAGHDPLALLRLERRMRLAWQLQSSDEAMLGSRLALRTPLQRRQAHWILSQLQRPLRWSRVLWLGMNIVNPELIADFVENTSEHHPEDLPDTIDRAQVEFWLAAAERHRVTRPRLLLGGVRGAALLVLGVLLAPLVSLLSISSVSFQPMLIVVSIFLLPSALWLIWMLWSQLVFWYLQEKANAVLRSARTYLVPALCASGVILGACGQDGLGLALLIPALWLAVRRYWYHHASRYAPLNSGYVRLIFLMAIPLLHAALNAGSGADRVSIGEIIAAAAMLAWAADLRKQRQGQADAN